MGTVIVALTTYETWSLALTAIYDLLTFLLLLAVAYEGLIRPRLPNLGLYLVPRPQDTKGWSWQAATLDFVLENRGTTPLSNIAIRSEPDDLGWGALGGRKGVPTSRYFSLGIPRLDVNERRQIFWCEASQNQQVVAKPVVVTIEFDNCVFLWPRRLRRSFNFDLGVWTDVIHGVNTRYGIHNVAQELSRIREILEKRG